MNWIAKPPVGISPAQTQNQLGTLETDKNADNELNSKKTCEEKPRMNKLKNQLGRKQEPNGWKPRLLQTGKHPRRQLKVDR